MSGDLFRNLLAGIAVLALAAGAAARNGLWQDAVLLGTDVATKSPAKARAYHDLGCYYFQKDKLDEARTLFGTAVRLNPRYARAWCNLGAVYLREGFIDTALAYLRRAEELDPSIAVVHFNLGLAYQAREEREQAARHYATACSMGHEEACTEHAAMDNVR